MSRRSKTAQRDHEIADRGGTALLEHEVADLKEANERLQRSLQEAEMSAELRARAERILAIPRTEDS